MEQVKGSVHIYGSIENYANKVAVLKESNIFKLTFASYYVSLSMQRGDRSSGRVTVGYYQSPMIYFSYDKSSFNVPSNDIIDSYNTFGFNAISSFRFDCPWDDKYSQFELTADCNTLPTITNLSVDNVMPRKDIIITWDSEHQDLYEITATTGGNIIYSSQGTNEKSHTIPANTFSDEQKIDISVKVIFTNNNTLTTNAYAKENLGITLKQPQPKISNFKPNGLVNALAPIQVTWQSELQNSYRLEIITDNKVIQSFSGASETVVTIPKDTLYNGNISLKLVISDGFVETEHIETITVNNNPKVKILGLEPQNSVRNSSFPIEISWTAINQKRWLLQILENGRVKADFNGTNQDKVILPANFLNVGNITLNLTVFNTVYDLEYQDSKTATFTTISKPNAPNIAEKSNFNEARPIFSWNPDGLQKAYQVIIFKGNDLIEDSNIVDMEVPSYAVKTSLKNETTYIVKVRTKNQYELWSDYARKEIYISLTLLEPATFNLTPNQTDSSILINFTSIANADFGENQIWRSEGIDEFKLVALNLGANDSFIDYYVPGNKILRYKILSKSKNGAITESIIKETQISIRGFLLSSAEEMAKRINLKFNYSIGFENIRNRHFVKYLGNRKLIIENDNTTSYQKGKFTFDMKLEDYYLLENLYDEDKTLFYRDNRGKALFCAISNLSSEYHFKIPDWIKVSFELYEVENEIEAYESNFVDKILKEILIGGNWQINGEKDLTGWEWVNK